MKPVSKRFTQKERHIIGRYRTPYQVQQYLNALPYNVEKKGETLRSFRGVVRTRTAHCLEAALAAAVILEQHGYPVLFLDIESQDNLDHVMFLYNKKGLWGTVARSRDPGLHGRKPVFTTVRTIVDSYFDPFIDLTGRVIGYAVTTLDGLGGYDWRLSKRNVWKVQEYLAGIPHRPFHGSDRRYRDGYERYLAYRKRFPDRKPFYYRNRGTWTSGYPKGTGKG